MTAPIPPRKHRPQLPLAAYRWLLAGQRSSWSYLTLRSADEQRAFWEQHRAAVLTWWTRKHPGTRPRQWWVFDSVGPRKPCGGIGTPLSECEGAHAALFEFGVPVDWKTEHHHDLLVGVPISSAHPPMFESEAEYLRRHQLFMPGERKRLSRRSYEPVVLIRRDGNYILLPHDRVERFERVGPLRPYHAAGV
jgi:hypothetical protein